jgi:hypothetical protein
MSCFGLWTGSTVNLLRAHSHIWIHPKITNFVESKLFTWLKHTRLEHEQEDELKLSRNSVKGIRANCSQSNYIGH